MRNDRASWKAGTPSVRHRIVTKDRSALAQHFVEEPVLGEFDVTAPQFIGRPSDGFEHFV
jgi:hypothetical protein